MVRLVLSVSLLAACGGTPPYFCSAVVSGTGTAADGAYECQNPPNATYDPSQKTGNISGVFFSRTGLVLSFAVNTSGPPAIKTYSDTTLSPGDTYRVVVTSSGNSLWQAETGSNSVALTLTRMEAHAYYGSLVEAWSVLSGNMNATLAPTQDNAAKTNASVALTFR